MWIATRCTPGKPRMFAQCNIAAGAIMTTATLVYLVSTDCSQRDIRPSALSKNVHHTVTSVFIFLSLQQRPHLSTSTTIHKSIPASPLHNAAQRLRSLPSCGHHFGLRNSYSCRQCPNYSASRCAVHPPSFQARSRASHQKTGNASLPRRTTRVSIAQKPRFQDTDNSKRKRS